MRSSLRVPAVFVTLLLAACGSENSGSGPGADSGVIPGPDGQAPELDFSAFDAEVEAFLTENALEGASAVIVHADYGILHESGYGAFDADRMYLIASSSKILSVGILMKLVDDGLLDLDAPISTYLSEWGDYKSDITVAQLVSNSSGLTSLTDNPAYGPYLCQYIDTGTLADCARTIYTADDAADRLPPDTEFHYGGGQWQLAGGIAEVVSGKSWAELVTETYVEPCGVPSTAYTNQFLRAASGGGDITSALGYPTFFMQDVANLPVTDNPSIEGGAYTVAADYGKILLMHLRGGLCDDTRVLTAESVATMQVDRIGEAYGGMTPNPAMAGYGLGWWVDRNNPGVVSDGGAYGAMPWLDNERKYGAFILLEANSGFGAGLMMRTKAIVDEIVDGI